MSTSVASDERWTIAAGDLRDRGTSLTEQAHRDGGRRPRYGIVALLKEAGLLLLVVLMCPLAILIVGAPVVLLVRLLIEIAKRL